MSAQKNDPNTKPATPAETSKASRKNGAAAEAVAPSAEELAQELSEQQRVRREKLARLQAEGP